MVRQSFMVGGQSRAKLLTSYWLGSRESRTRYSSPLQKTDCFGITNFFSKFIFLKLYVFYVDECVWLRICIYLGAVEREEQFGSLELELEMIVSHHVCAQNQIQVLCKRSQGHLISEPSLRCYYWCYYFLNVRKRKIAFHFFCVCAHSYMGTCVQTSYHHGHVEVRGRLARVNIPLHVSHRD